MDSSHQKTACKATDYLIHTDTEQLSPMLLYRQITAGFLLQDVHDMLLAIAPNTMSQVLRRILGKSSCTVRHLDLHPALLSSRQSTVAFQYAKVFDQALVVFGTHQLAERWLAQPCRLFAGTAPLDILDNPYVLQALTVYLQRIEHGVYQ